MEKRTPYFEKIDTVKQFNIERALRKLIGKIYKEITQMDYEGEYNTEIEAIAKIIATEQVENK